ncbi:MAG: hypothetical protein IJX13_00050, partial [Clostridia bacterium]|nr:hypothetical protein [Clostridia bacterium]
MKNQHMKTKRTFSMAKLLVVMAMLVALACLGGVLVSAAGGSETGKFDKITVGDWTQDAESFWCKTYDGTTAVPEVKLTVDGQEIVADSAVFNSANVAEASHITVAYTVDGEQYTVTLPAKITPATLTWNDGVKAQTTATYDPAKTQYVGLSFDLPAGELFTGAVNGETVEIGAVSGVSISAVDVTGTNGVTAYSNVTLKVGDAVTDNYVIAPLLVEVAIAPIEIENVIWNQTNFDFVYGDAGIFELQAWGDVAGNDTEKDIALNVMIKVEDGETVKYLSLTEAYAQGLYGRVKKADADGTKYTVWACAPNGLYSVSEALATKVVKISKQIYTATLSDAEYLTAIDLANGFKPVLYQLRVQSDNIPEDILARISYVYVNKDGKSATAGVSDFGTYTVAATMPDLSYTLGGVTFEDCAFAETALTAKLNLKKNYLILGNDEEPVQMIIIGSNGISESLTATLTVPTLNSKAIHGYHVHKEYTLQIKGAASGETFTVLIPVASSFVSNENCEALTVTDLYLYDDSVGSMVAANGKYNVTLSEDGAYYQITGYASEGEVSFVIAPVYHAPFWVTAPGIALIILLVLLVLVALFLIGLKLRQIERSNKAGVLVIDTEGDVPAVVPVVVEDKIDDPDACLAESIDGLADALRDDIDAAVAEEADVDASDAVADALNEMKDEASAISLIDPDDPDLAAANEMTDAMAEELAQGLQETTEAAKDESDVSDEVNAAVAEAMEENFNESADATDAIVLLAGDEEEISPEEFREVIDAIVADAMMNTMVLPEDIFAAEEAAEEAPEATEEVAEEATEEVVEEEATEAVEKTVEEPVEESAPEAVEETVEEAAPETVEEAVEEIAEDTSVCAMVADSVAEAFEAVTVDGETPEAVEGTTKATITEAVNNAATAYVPNSWSEELTDEVKTAVVAELAARLVEDDSDDDEENFSFGSFGSMPLDFIDVIAEAERYNDMLAQESRGEVQLVTRYRRSFQSRLIQSQGSVPEYYNIIKNLLLSYKGIKNRISWNYESFNLGRTQVAKFNAKTRTLYVYMALSPEEVADSKYVFVDESSKKKYASVPVLMK